jgi:hypothetical protein
MRFDWLGPAGHLIVDEGDRAVEAIQFPTRFVSLPIGERATQHGQADCVGVPSGVAQCAASANADHDR